MFSRGSKKTAKTAKTTKSTKTAPKVNPRLRFLTLPVEIRELIYDEILHSMPASLLQLIRTNRQIHHEAQPFVFRQPLSFDGQSDFFDMFYSVNRKYLRYIQVIEFALHDIDPEKIVGALGKRLRQAKMTSASQAQNNNPYLEACDSEVRRIGEVFSRLPNVKRFTIVGPKPSDAQPCRHMLICLTKELVQHFTDLQQLNVEIDALPIQFIRHLKRLRSLRLTGFSTSTPAEALSTLRALPHLTSLEIMGSSSDLTFEQRPGHPGPRSVQCITPAVIDGLPNIKRLTIYDPLDPMSSSEQANFLNAEMFHMLAKRSKIRKLCIATDRTSVPTDTLKALGMLICTSPSLRLLDLALPLDLIPTMIQQLTDARPAVDFEDAMEAVAEELDMDGGTTSLKELKICVRGSKSTQVNRMRSVVKEWAEEKAAQAKVAFSWGRWDDWFARNL
ncbi:hypothetical protein MMC20_004902 [Loxospora ochrophaea]|nr:hypothetical protein [Loxospora ochrophaea]